MRNMNLFGEMKFSFWKTLVREECTVLWKELDVYKFTETKKDCCQRSFKELKDLGVLKDCDALCNVHVLPSFLFSQFPKYFVKA